MARLTGGEGWSLSSYDEPKLPKKVNPHSPKPKIRLEKRRGKPVTVVSGLHTYGSEKMQKMAKALKSGLGVGGTVKNGCIELQGDRVEPVKKWLDNNL